jgi:hypothetical protein
MGAVQYSADAIDAKQNAEGSLAGVFTYEKGSLVSITEIDQISLLAKKCLFQNDQTIGTHSIYTILLLSYNLIVRVRCQYS